MGKDLDGVVKIIASGDLPASLSPGDWSGLVQAARRANLLGTLAVCAAHLADALPTGARRHLDGARQLSQRQADSVRWEAHALSQILAPLNVPVVLLKGAAYVLAQTPNHRGRLFGDVDILVPKEALGAVERALMTNGWTPLVTDTYDQRYYRQWMHELPPMVHVRRGTVVDIHHNILPSTARYAPSGQAVIDASVPLPDLFPLRLPTPEDLLLHSVTHLFHEGELNNGLRDLADIASLARHYSAMPDFWDQLVTRAQSQTLLRPLYYGLHFASRIMQTAVPESVFQRLRPAAPPEWLSSMMDALYLRGFAGAVDGATAGWALSIIYLRAHWLRMPPHLLALHLARKSWKRITPDKRLPPPRQ